MKTAGQINHELENNNNNRLEMISSCNRLYPRFLTEKQFNSIIARIKKHYARNEKEILNQTRP